jgi:heme o synthase
MSRTLRWFTAATAGLTLFLIVAGGLVTSTGSGLAVPDWPLSYGRLNPPMVGGIFYEHGHRLVAMLVGFLTTIQALWLWRKGSRKALSILGFSALALVILQGVLGGLTVLYLLPTPISVSHAMMGQTFLCVMASIAFLSSRWGSKTSFRGESASLLPTFALVTTIAIYIQLFFGAVMRHTHAGLAIPDFPFFFGKLWPPVFTDGVLIHFVHRIWALVVSAAAVATAVYVRRRNSEDKDFVRLSFGIVFLIALQITLGAWTVLSERSVAPTTAHVATGAATLALSLLLTLASWRRFGSPSIEFRSFLALTKPRITFMVLFTTMCGFRMATTGVWSWSKTAWTLIATTLVASGANALNQYIEREFDSKMNRTRSRPLPSGKLSARRALWFGLMVSFVGFGLYVSTVNFRTAVVALFTWGSYLFVYTPLKRISSLSTVVGAVPGAMPPLIGWIAASGGFHWHALIPFMILFLWQMPHFYSIGWLYREDYQRAGFPILPVLDPSGRRMSMESILYAGALFGVALLPIIVKLSGPIYFATACALGILFLFATFLMGRDRSLQAAKQLLMVSVIYLPTLFLLMAMDRW